jgi:hypothetical protein
LLKPGGVLAVIGLYRMESIADYAWAAAGKPASWILRCGHALDAVSAPLREPKETLGEIRTACREVLPGAELGRLVLFRYLLTWRKA